MGSSGLGFVGDPSFLILYPKTASICVPNPFLHPTPMASLKCQRLARLCPSSSTRPLPTRSFLPVRAATCVIFIHFEKPRDEINLVDLMDQCYDSWFTGFILLDTYRIMRTAGQDITYPTAAFALLCIWILYCIMYICISVGIFCGHQINCKNFKYI